VSSGSVEGVDLERGERVIGLGHVSTSQRERANPPDVAGSRTAIRSQNLIRRGRGRADVHAVADLTGAFVNPD
jgi:hypothetical protein